MQLEMKIVHLCHFRQKTYFRSEKYFTRVSKTESYFTAKQTQLIFQMTTSFFSFLTIVHSDRLTGAVCSDITGSGDAAEDCCSTITIHYPGGAKSA